MDDLPRMFDFDDDDEIHWGGDTRRFVRPRTRRVKRRINDFSERGGSPSPRPPIHRTEVLPIIRLPPIHPHQTWKNGGKWQFVWPKDKPKMNKVDRLKDCLTGKGPNVFIATRWGWEEPHRPAWSGWKTRGCQDPRDVRIRWTNAGFPFEEDNELVSWDPAARRGERDGRRYDFRTRKYVKPKGGEWSDVVWDQENPNRALYWRDAKGYEYVDPEYDNEGFNWGIGRNAFHAEGAHDRRRPHPGRFFHR